MSRPPFALHYDADGVYDGWRITFTLVEFPARNVPTVTARNGSRIMRDPHKIADILPVGFWPDFARTAYRQRVDESSTDERLF